MEKDLTRGNGAPRPAPGDSLVAVARDAIDAAKTMAQDGARIATLEARRAAHQVGPKIAWGLVATVFGVVGGLLAIVALFIAAEVVIPSIAGRLALFAVVFLAVAFFGALQMRAPARAQPGVTQVQVHARVNKGIAPIHPVEGIGK